MSHTPCLTDIDGILVGRCTLRKRPTGCSVIYGRKPFVAGVDVRGGGPGRPRGEILGALSLRARLLRVRKWMEPICESV